MHVVMFGDQHVASSGGAQVSMRLQRRFLERAGHTVTVVGPARHGRARERMVGGDAALVDLPSIPITFDSEYSLTWPGRRADRFVDAAMAGRPPVDVVHVQADFWGALIGHRFAARHRLPVVHTMHNRVDVGLAAVFPFPRPALRALNAWARRSLPQIRRASPDSDAAASSIRIQAASPNPRRSTADGWAYLRRFARLSAAVTAPSSHFARRLEEHGVFPAVDVVWNGIDDDVLDAASADPAARTPGRPLLVWVGRMSPEKRLLPFLEAVAASGIDADVEVIGGGGQARAARRLVQRLRPRASVVFSGRLPYGETLARLAAADAAVQTSLGFETQGMTVFEAASLGTPAVVADPDIAAELGAGTWVPADGSVAALADTLRAAVADIAAGRARSPEPGIGAAFRQSSRTAAMLEVYRRAIGRATG